MTDIKQLLPTTIYQAATDPLSLRAVANAANPFATLADIGGGGAFIPLSGTTFGNPVTGPIQVAQSFVGNVIYQNAGSVSQGLLFNGLGGFGLIYDDPTFTDPVFIALAGGQMVIQGPLATFQGVKYVQDFSPNFVGASLINKAYADITYSPIILTSGQVTTALGYTPYNVTNPAGYISGITSGMVTTALGFTPFGGTNPLPIANGGTAATTANTALNNLLPAQAGNAGKFLTTDGTNTSWATVSGGTTTLTLGQIAFGNASNLMTSDSTLFWNNTTKRLFIGAGPFVGTSKVFIQNTAFAEMGLIVRSTAFRAAQFMSEESGTNVPVVVIQNKSTFTGVADILSLDNYGHAATIGSANQIVFTNEVAGQATIGKYGMVMTNVTPGTFAADYTWQTTNGTTGVLVERMRLTGAGMLGIGTAAPTSPLQVVGLPAYLTNAAAITAGLTIGAFYRQTGSDFVAVVH